jgi:hypothetical protein
MANPSVHAGHMDAKNELSFTAAERTFTRRKWKTIFTHPAVASVAVVECPDFFLTSPVGPCSVRTSNREMRLTAWQRLAKFAGFNPEFGELILRNTAFVLRPGHGAVRWVNLASSQAKALAR